MHEEGLPAKAGGPFGIFRDLSHIEEQVVTVTFSMSGESDIPRHLIFEDEAVDSSAIAF